MTITIARDWMTRLRGWCGILLLAALTGCATPYVDGTTREIPVADFKKPVELRPVQLLFEFQTKGVANARATELLKTQVVDQVKSSGLFSEINTDGPVPGGAFLSISLNNIVLDGTGTSRAFMTGFTFGLVGSQVSDGYICTASYRPAMDATPIVKEARHAIHTTLGAAAKPGNAVQASSMKEAAQLMTRQVVSHVLSDLSQDAAFQ